MATAKKTAAVKVETVSTKQLAGALAEKHEMSGMSQKAANLVIEDTIALITKHLKKGARIRLNGLGILVVRKRGPCAWAAIRPPAKPSRSRLPRRSALFRASKELKESI